MLIITPKISFGKQDLCHLWSMCFNGGLHQAWVRGGHKTLIDTIRVVHPPGHDQFMDKYVAVGFVYFFLFFLSVIPGNTSSGMGDMRQERGGGLDRVCYQGSYHTESLLFLRCRVWLFVTPWAVAYQASLSMGFSRQYSQRTLEWVAMPSSRGSS